MNKVFHKAAIGLIIMIIAVVSTMIISGGDAYADSNLLKRKDRVWFGGETWIVINADKVANYKTNKKGILLLSEYVLEEARMYNKEPTGSWDGSIIQLYLKDLFEKQLNMTETEKNSIITAVKQGGNPDSLIQTGLTGDRFFLLDSDEVYNDMRYGSGMGADPETIPVTACWAPRRGGKQTKWWLRGNTEEQGIVIDEYPISVEIGNYQTNGIRPAFYLDPDTVESVDSDSDGIYVITFKDGSKSTDDTIAAMVPGVRELKRWNDTQDARWLYFGASNSNGDPAKWRAIGYDGSGTYNTSKGVLSLFANTFEYSWFGPNNRYCDSAVKKYFDDLVNKLPKGELDAIKKRTLLTENYNTPNRRVDGVAGNKVEDAVYWPLSCYEADSVTDAIIIDDIKSESWLRSPGSNNKVAVIIYHNNVNMVGVHQDDNSFTPDKYAGYRPVCWLMTDKVLFTTPAEGGKESGPVGPDALKAVGSTTTNEWKATVTDKSHEAFTVKSLEINCNESSMAVLTYSGAVIGENEYISAIITDKFDNISYYGRLKNCTSAEDSSGKIYVRLDDRLKDGNRIYFFNEQLNGDKKTDFASGLKGVAVTDAAKEDKDLPVVNVNKANTVGNFKKKQMKIVFPTSKKVDKYRVQYRLAGKKSWNNGWSKGTGTYVVKDLKKYSLCEFRIAGYAKKEDGTWVRSKWSNISYRYVSSTPIKTVKAGKKCIKLTWKKEGKSNGYKIQYSLKKNMAGRKTITIKSKSTTKYTIKKLKKGKTYYIRIRPIKKKSGKTYIGILSGIKKAKVK